MWERLRVPLRLDFTPRLLPVLPALHHRRVIDLLLAGLLFRPGGDWRQAGALAGFLAAAAVAVGNLAAQRSLALHRGFLDAAADALRLEAPVARGIDVRCGNDEAVTFDVRAQSEPIATQARARVDFQPIEWQRLADAVGNLLIARAAADDLIPLDVDVGDVGGSLEKEAIARDR